MKNVEALIVVALVAAFFSALALSWAKPHYTREGWCQRACGDLSAHVDDTVELCVCQRDKKIFEGEWRVGK